MNRINNCFSVILILVIVMVSICSGIVLNVDSNNIANAEYKVPDSGLPVKNSGGGYCADIPEGLGTKSIKSNGILIQNVDVLTKDTLKLAKIITEKFPEVKSIGGFRRCDGYSEHPSGKALDIMVANPQGYNKELGLKIKDWLIKNADKVDLKWAIWDKYSYSKGGSTKFLGNRGSNTDDHKDHVHVFLNGSGKFTMDGGGDSSDDSGDGNVCEPSESSSTDNEGDSGSKSSIDSTKMLMVGDSITVGSKDLLEKEFKGIKIDAEVGRPFGPGKKILENNKSKYNKKGATVIVELGTNGGMTKDNISTIKKMYDKANLYFVNTFVAKSLKYTPGEDKIIESTNKALSDSGVKVIDWNSKAKDSLISNDGVGVHPNGEGKKVFVKTIVEGVKGGSSSSDDSSSSTDCDTGSSSKGNSDGEYTGALEFDPFIKGKPVQNTTGVDYKNKEIGASEGYIFASFFKSVIYIIMLVALVLTAIYIVSIAVLILGIAIDSPLISENKFLRKIGGDDFVDTLRGYGITGSLKQIGIRFGIPVIILNLVILGVVGQVQNLLVSKVIEVIELLF